MSVDEPDGSLTVKFRTGGLREMCWHWFRWGNTIEIIAPQLLVEEMNNQLKVHGMIYLSPQIKANDEFHHQEIT